MSESYHIHLVSDATGETTHSVARACLVQFDDIRVIEHLWPMVRTKGQVDIMLQGIRDNPGVVIFTLVNNKIRTALQRECRRLELPCISVLDPVIDGLGRYFNRKISGRPGGQHEMGEEYFNRIEAMNFVMTHDDGQSAWDVGEADVILLGVSRTSKTPTSIYLANHWGIKTANVPIVPGIPLPDQIFDAEKPFIVGLTTAPERLVQIRRNRLLMLRQNDETDYVDIDTVKREVATARKLFAKYGWPVIDVSRRSIEETAAAIFQLYTKRHDEANPGTGSE